jgi:hypothetical protein
VNADGEMIMLRALGGTTEVWSGIWGRLIRTKPLPRSIPAQLPSCPRQPLDLSGSQPTPASVTSPRRQLQDRPASAHARRLLASLQANPLPFGESVTYEIIREAYALMLVDLGWAELPWQTVAHQFTSITSGKKKYQDFWRNGKKHRLRVYPIPSAASSAVADEACQPADVLTRQLTQAVLQQAAGCLTVGLHR